MPKKIDIYKQKMKELQKKIDNEKEKEDIRNLPKLVKENPKKYYDLLKTKEKNKVVKYACELVNNERFTELKLNEKEKIICDFLKMQEENGHYFNLFVSKNIND